MHKKFLIVIEEVRKADLVTTVDFTTKRRKCLVRNVALLGDSPNRSVNSRSGDWVSGKKKRLQTTTNGLPLQHKTYLTL